MDTDNKAIISSTDSIDGWQAGRFHEEIARRVALLKKIGVGPGDRVLIFKSASPGFFADLFAVWQLGGCAMCLSTSLTMTELSNIESFTSPRLLLVDKTFSSDKAIGTKTVVSELETTEDATYLPPGFGSSIDDDALVLFTSGTTGVPKGVTHSYRSILSRVMLNRNFIGDAVLQRTLCFLPTHFGHGLIGNCLTPLFAGKRLVLSSFNGLSDAARLSEHIDNYGITFLSSVPTNWTLVLKASDTPRKGTLRQISIGSAPLTTNLWNQVIEWSGTKNVVNMYGITETANWLAGASAARFEPSDGLVGEMWGGLAAVITEDGDIQSEGRGELIVQSPSLMKGYLENPDLTRSILKDGWFKTGDNGSISDDGTIIVGGRKDDQINRAGIKIQPEEVESMLEKNECIQEACVFGLLDGLSGEKVAAAIIPNVGKKVDTAKLREWCSARIRRECIPEKWFVVSEIPRNDRGKVSRRDVREQLSY